MEPISHKTIPFAVDGLVLLVAFDVTETQRMIHIVKAIAPNWTVANVSHMAGAQRYVAEARSRSTPLPFAIFIEIELPPPQLTKLLDWIDAQADLANARVLVISDAGPRPLHIASRCGRRIWILPKPVSATFVAVALFFD